MSIPGERTGWRTVRKPVYVSKLNAVLLEFDGAELGLFYIRGSVQWPRGVMPGYVIAAGQDLKSKTVIIFDGQEFETVEMRVAIDPMNNDARVIEKGFTTFANTAWKTWGVEKYFWGQSQSDDLHKRYRIQVRRAKEMHFAPTFAQAHYAAEDENVDRIVYDMYRSDKVRVPEKMVKYLDREQKDTEHVRDAFRALLAGYHRNPWRGTKEKQHDFITKMRRGL